MKLSTYLLATLSVSGAYFLATESDRTANLLATRLYIPVVPVETSLVDPPGCGQQIPEITNETASNLPATSLNISRVYQMAVEKYSD